MEQTGTETLHSVYALVDLETAGAHVTGARSPGTRSGADYQAFVLSHWNGERFVVVGGLVVQMKSASPCSVDVRMLAAAAEALYFGAKEAPTVVEHSG